MARVDSAEIIREIERVLLGANHGKGNPDCIGLMTAYQILKRLPAPMQDLLEREYGGSSGRGAGRPFSPATRVAQIASGIPGVQQEYLDARDLAFDIGAEEAVEAGYQLCAAFRLPADHRLRSTARR